MFDCGKKPAGWVPDPRNLQRAPQPQETLPAAIADIAPAAVRPKPKRTVARKDAVQDSLRAPPGECPYCDRQRERAKLAMRKTRVKE